MSSNQVVLMGFMGAGKSSVGPRLAARLDWRFLDLDAMLAARFGLAANQQLARFGEAEFRRREVALLGEALRIRPLVLALGGGTVTVEGAQALIREAGALVLWLDVEWKVVAMRLRRGRRPLWRGPWAERRALYERRRTLYERLADVRVDAGGKAQRVAEAAYRLLEARGVV